MGIASTDELIASEIFLESQKIRKIHIPILLQECILFVVSWLALRYLHEMENRHVRIASDKESLISSPPSLVMQ